MFLFYKYLIDVLCTNNRWLKKCIKKVLNNILSWSIRKILIVKSHPYHTYYQSNKNEKKNKIDETKIKFITLNTLQTLI